MTRVTLKTFALDTKAMEFSNSLAMLSEGKAVRAQVRALNHEGKKAFTAVTRKMAKATSIPVRVIRSELKLHQAWDNNLSVAIHARGRPKPLADFGPKQFKYGVRAKVWGKSQRFDGAFMVVKFGQNVFKNTGGFNKKSGRHNALEKLYGPSLPVELLKQEVWDEFEASFHGLPARLAHETARMIERDA